MSSRVTTHNNNHTWALCVPGSISVRNSLLQYVGGLFCIVRKSLFEIDSIYACEVGSRVSSLLFGEYFFKVRDDAFMPDICHDLVALFTTDALAIFRTR